MEDWHWSHCTFGRQASMLILYLGTRADIVWASAHDCDNTYLLAEGCCAPLTITLELTSISNLDGNKRIIRQTTGSTESVHGAISQLQPSHYTEHVPDKPVPTLLDCWTFEHPLICEGLLHTSKEYHHETIE